MKRLLLFPLIAFLFSCSADGQKPTKADITTAMKSTWEKAATSSEPRKTVTINDIKFGSSEKASVAKQADGIPKGALITNAKIDWTQTLYYTNETQHVHRIMTAWVYKNAFGEWEVMSNGSKEIK